MLSNVLASMVTIPATKATLSCAPAVQHECALVSMGADGILKSAECQIARRKRIAWDAEITAAIIASAGRDYGYRRGRMGYAAGNFAYGAITSNGDHALVASLRGGLRQLACVAHALADHAIALTQTVDAQLDALPDLDRSAIARHRIHDHERAHATSPFNASELALSRLC